MVKVWGLGFRSSDGAAFGSGKGSRVWFGVGGLELGFGVEGRGFGICGLLSPQISELGFWVAGFGSWVWGYPRCRRWRRLSAPRRQPALVRVLGFGRRVECLVFKGFEDLVFRLEA